MDELIAPESKTIPVAGVSVENGMLKFADEAAAESTLSMLLKMDETQLAAWYDSIGFVLQETVYNKALDEMENMVSDVAYPALKAKYQDILLFNDVDVKDKTPYLPTQQVGYSLILNTSGFVLIGNEIKNYNYGSFRETKYYRSTLPQTKDYDKDENVNYLYVHEGDRKFWAEAGRANDVVFIEFTARKTTIVGWNTYKTKYCTRLTSANDDAYAWKSLNPEEISTVVGQDVWLREIKSHSRMRVGIMNKLLPNPGATTAYWPRINRQYYVCSRGSRMEGY